MPSLRLVVAASLAALLIGCQSARRPLVIDSDPPGALVRINGEDSGFATPCVLDIDDRSVKSVELELAGYRSERRELKSGGWTQITLWRDMTNGIQTWNFPLFMPLRYVLLPVVESKGESPNRIHARLVRERPL